MTEFFIYDIAKSVLGKLGSLALEQFLLSWGFEDDLEKMNKVLVTITAVVLDAEQQQSRNHRIELWLTELKHVLYDIQDLVDEFECEGLRKRVVKIGCAKVRHFFSSSNSFVFCHRMARKLKKIREKVDEIAKLKSDFGLTESYNSNRFIPCSRYERNMTHSFVDSAHVVGREKDKEKIIKYLISNVEKLSVLPIVGMGGLGKTTLAKLVYNDERLASHFQVKVWVCVSDDFDLQKLLTKIIKSVGDEMCNDWEIDRLQRVFRDALTDKKYLIVLDDLWNEDATKWVELISLFRDDANGSRIIITTRSNRVASITGSVLSYNLNDLSFKDCLSLFLKCAFRGKQGEQHQNLIKIGEEIVEKCKGVPLAVVTLGNLLYSVSSEQDWKSVRDNELWKLDQNDNGILSALRISYDHLPFYLKRCFAYCSFFPKDHQYNDFHLVQFWMAHGLLQSQNDNDELEDIGFSNLEELISRSFFINVEERYGFLKFSMHDLVHDLATMLTKDECAMVNFRTRQISSSARHLLFVDPTSTPEGFRKMVQGLDRVRTIAPLVDLDGFDNMSTISICLSRFRYLRWLNLRYSKLEVLPESIGTLKHLRFLNLSFSKVKRLPKSLYKLHSLQTLWLGVCNEIEELPADIRSLISLRSLIISTKQKSLPKNGIGCLKSLRFLFIGECQHLENLFEDMNGLINLQTLIVGNCESLTSFPPSIKCLTALKTLVITNCENMILTMEEGFAQFSLRKLIIEGLPKLVDLPQWILESSTNTLQFLQLENCDNLRELPACLRSLTALQELKIDDCDELSEKCEAKNGEHWPKIAHIPKIIIDGINIQSVDD